MREGFGNVLSVARQDVADATVYMHEEGRIPRRWVLTGFYFASSKDTNAGSLLTSSARQQLGENRKYPWG